MEEQRIAPVVLVNVVIAVGLTLLPAPLHFGWLTTIGGLCLLLILFGYDQQRTRSMVQSIAFCSICGLAFVLTAGVIVQQLADRPNLETFLCATWAAGKSVAPVYKTASVSRAGNSRKYSFLVARGVA